MSGFDYAFHAIQDESNEVYLAYRDMFEIVLSQGQDRKALAGIYFPLIHRLWASRFIIHLFLVVKQRD